MLSKIVRPSIRSCTRKRCPNFLSSTRSISVDITGNELTGYVSKDLQAIINDGISNLITKNNIPLCITSEAKRDLSENTDNIPFLDIMLILSLLKFTPSDLKLSRLQLILKNLEKQHLEGKLNDREIYYSAASLALLRGEYSRAAHLFESSILKTENDYLALKLAQDSYILAGDTINPLKCMHRWDYYFSKNHPLHIHTTSMFATGHIQVSYSSDLSNEIEDICNRGVDITSGKDISAIVSLLDFYLTRSRGADVISVSDYYIPKYKGLGKIYLLFYKGMACQQRGSYRVALGLFDDILEWMQLEKENVNSEVLHLVTTLLLQISLNHESFEFNRRWHSLELLEPWNNLRENSYSILSPIQKVSLNIALSFAAKVKTSPYALSSDEKLAKPSPTPEIVAQSEPKESGSTGGWGNMFFKAARVVFNNPQRPNLLVSPSELDSEALLQNISFSPKQEKENDDKFLSSFDSKNYPLLSAVKPSISYPFFQPDRLSFPGTDSQWQTSTVGHSVSSAVRHFAKNEFSEVHEKLRPLEPIFSRLGGLRGLSTLFEYMYLDSALKIENLREAESYLLGRTYQCPNDGQSYRRLSKLYRDIGQMRLAKDASDTAQSLGLDQPSS